MKSCVWLLLVAGCLAGTLDANTRPAVIPKLSEMPADKRDDIQAQANATDGPEGRQKLSRRERKVETAAAFAAAIIGSAFSKHETVLLGTSTFIDENRLFEKKPAQRRALPPQEGSGAPLVPWIKLPGSGSGSDDRSPRAP